MVGLVFFTSLVDVSELVYPVHIDSLYIKAQQDEYVRELQKNKTKILPRFYYSPFQLGIEYSELEFTTRDQLKLKGWFIPVKDKSNAITILMLHDLNESRISLL
jgi:hypothetical protein